MYCNICGNNIENNCKFCPFCGTQLNINNKVNDLFDDEEVVVNDFSNNNPLKEAPLIENPETKNTFGLPKAIIGTIFGYISLCFSLGMLTIPSSASEIATPAESGLVSVLACIMILIISLPFNIIGLAFGCSSSHKAQIGFSKGGKPIATRVLSIIAKILSIIALVLSSLIFILLCINL